jgi:WD40 repeat protein
MAHDALPFLLGNTEMPKFLHSSSAVSEDWPGNSFATHSGQRTLLRRLQGYQVQIPDPGPKALAAASAVLLAAVVGVFVSMSPHQEASRKIRVLALSSSGRWMAGGTPKGSIYIWDLQQSTSAAKIVESTGTLNDLRFSRDGEYLAIANKNIVLVPLSSGGEPRVVRADKANYGSVRFSSGSRSLLTINGQGSVILINLSTGLVSPVYCCSSIWGDVDFSPDETQLLWAGHWPGVWDLRSGALIGRLTKSREFMTFGPIATDPKQKLIYMGSQDGRVYEWSLETRKPLGKSPPQSGYVYTIAVLGTSGWVAYAAEDGPVHLWHPRTGANRIVQAARTTSNLVFDESRNQTTLGTESGYVEFWDLVAGRLLSTRPATY